MLPKRSWPGSAQISVPRRPARKRPARTCDVPQLQAHHIPVLPIQHFQSKIHTDLRRPPSSAAVVVPVSVPRPQPAQHSCSRRRSPMRARAAAQRTDRCLVVLRKHVVDVTLDDAGLSGANVAHHKHLVQVFLRVIRLAARARTGDGKRTGDGLARGRTRPRRPRRTMACRHGSLRRTAARHARPPVRRAADRALRSVRRGGPVRPVGPERAPCVRACVRVDGRALVRVTRIARRSGACAERTEICCGNARVLYGIREQPRCRAPFGRHRLPTRTRTRARAHARARAGRSHVRALALRADQHHGACMRAARGVGRADAWQRGCVSAAMRPSSASA